MELSRILKEADISIILQKVLGYAKNVGLITSISEKNVRNVVKKMTVLTKVLYIMPMTSRIRTSPSVILYLFNEREGIRTTSDLRFNLSA